MPATYSSLSFIASVCMFYFNSVFFDDFGESIDPLKELRALVVWARMTFASLDDMIRGCVGLKAFSRLRWFEGIAVVEGDALKRDLHFVGL